TRHRFSAWFRARPKVRIGNRQARVALVPTCVVEFTAPAIGHDLVRVYERNGIEVALADVGCCGAPLLQRGDTLADQVRKGDDIVVAQPTCALTVRRDYLAHVPGADTEAVAAHTYDASEYLMRQHRSGESLLDTDFVGPLPRSIVYHAPCHIRAQRVGLKGRDLLRLTGATVSVVQQCSGIDGVGGLRASADELAGPLAARLAEELERRPAATIVGDCHLSNVAIAGATGRVPSHPLQVLARAYGFAPEPEA
ncbi:MAG TPA: heterodisulfide reductase-related iron-sulfur binding cluster, partial [Ilumatobacteraceae bacterium]|nr:heterodisulfide reductase-related iron-sulfur binding cluster [Ilumatobacteraceae bacterium]